MAEMEFADQLSHEMSNMLLTYEKIPPKETVTERLTNQYYGTVTLQLSNLVRLHAGHILAEKVFSHMDDENVVSLVQHMLTHQKHHVALRQLHHMFSHVYWKSRLTYVKKLCPTWDVITIPNTIGLLQFAQLCLRRISILRRKSPVVEREMDCIVYRGEHQLYSSFGSTVE